MQKQLTAMQAEKNTHVNLFTMDDFFDRVRKTYDSVARRAYEIFETNGRRFGRDLENWFQAESELLYPVHLEVVDSGEVLIIYAEVPGFKAEDIEVNVEPRRVTITGRRKTTDEARKGKPIYTERSSDQILRVVDLPAEIDTDKTAAILKDGILQLKMPKAVSAKEVKLEAKAA